MLCSVPECFECKREVVVHNISKLMDISKKFPDSPVWRGWLRPNGVTVVSNLHRYLLSPFQEPGRMPHVEAAAWQHQQPPGGEISCPGSLGWKAQWTLAGLPLATSVHGIRNKSSKGKPYHECKFKFRSNHRNTV